MKSGSGGDLDFGDLNFFSEKVNWCTLENELGKRMRCLDSRGLNSSEMMEKFSSTCLDVAREFVPPRKTSPTHKHRIPKDRRILMRTRRRVIQQKAVATGGTRRDALDRRLVQIEKKIQLSQMQQAEFEEDRAVENIKRKSL